MTSWSLPQLLDGLHDRVQHELGQSRDLIGHPVAKGDESEGVWIGMLEQHVPAKSLDPIIGGILTLESGWSNPALGQPLRDALNAAGELDWLDFGCVANHGFFKRESDAFSISMGGKSATAFLFELLASLQARATVGMMDVRAYARWLDDPTSP